MHIGVVGSGYVGLVAGACFAELGHDVVVVDNDESKLAVLESGGVPIHEEFLPELISRHRGRRLLFSPDLPGSVRRSDVIFIAVGTPPAEDGAADLSYVESVAREIAGAIDQYKVVVEKSTVPVYTANWIRKIMVLNGAPQDLFDVASNPEFLREGTAVTDFLYPDRIVIGADTEPAAGLLREIYRPLTDASYAGQKLSIPAPSGVRIPAQLIQTSTESAEIIKHASNAFLAMKISFINAVANICECVGADIEQVRAGVGSDSRIGPRFLSPGVGYGGSCFPKDVAAFRAVARECGYDFRLLDEVSRINEDQRRRFLRKVRSALWTLKGKRLGVLGLAFKGGTDDIRESPAVAIVEALLREGCHVSICDPAAVERGKEALASANGSVSFTDDPYECAEGKDALLILTDWEDFANLDLERLRGALHYPVIVDGRNLYDPREMAAKGFLYSSIGRRDAFPTKAQAAGLRKAS